MKTHLNTLFVTTQGAYFAKDGEAVAVRVENETKLRVPLHNLDGIVCFGRVGCSPALMGACGEAGVSLSFLSMHRRFRAAVIGFTPGNVLLRRQHYRTADDEPEALEFARSLVLAKIANCRTVLLRAARDANVASRVGELQKTAVRLSAVVPHVQQVTRLDQLRGLEGGAANSYFGAFNHLTTTISPAFQFTQRSRRPPLDPLNALLAFVYTLLMHDARAACEAAGLDAAVGFLQRDRHGRPGMALDLMQEFRPWPADRLVLSLINRRQVTEPGFELLGQVPSSWTKALAKPSWSLGSNASKNRSPTRFSAKRPPSACCCICRRG